MKTENDSNGDAQARSSLALGSAAWLRAVADDREEMLHALGALDEEGERETKREILGMRDAAAQLDRLKTAHDLAEAFLRWPLPDSVCADLCATKQGPGRVGTNLLSYTEAKQMFEQLLPNTKTCHGPKAKP